MLTELESYIVMIHMVMAQALLACFLIVHLDAWRGLSLAGRRPDGRVLLSAAAALGVLLLILTGSYVALSGAAGACNQWPLCQGGKFFVASELPLIHVAHRLASVMAVLLLGATAWSAWRSPARQDVKFMTLLAIGIFAAQVLVGALTVWWGLPTALRALHVALATLTWAALVTATLLPFTRERRQAG